MVYDPSLSLLLNDKKPTFKSQALLFLQDLYLPRLSYKFLQHLYVLRDLTFKFLPMLSFKM